MAMAMAMAAAVAVPDSARAMTAAYESLCMAGDQSPQAVLALADRSGWRRSGADAPKNFDPAFDRLIRAGDATLMLDVRDSVSLGERRTICGISTASPQPALIADVQAMLGVAPTYHVAASATFFAVRENGTWKDGSKLTRAEFTVAKAAGTFYSVVVGGTDHDTTLFSLRVRPDRPVP
ncbi:MAG: hypothetical protein WC729_03920 [Sphingomonas sp.]|uniref:hypothetical protein n=1 Tax=Sphingomonas sp. TaxID=28214 RepID=UPI00356431FA